MAQLAFTLAAVAAAPFTGGGSLALLGNAAFVAAASYAGGQVDMALKAPVRGPRLGDQQFGTATYGLPIPKGWGTVRLPGNVIWTNGIKENASTEKTKGKGLKGPAVTSFNYTASFAVAFAFGPADKILKIYADGKPVYDITSDAVTPISSASGNAAFPFRFYPGSETQTPDPLIVSETDDADSTPAYRGIVYIVVEDALLAPYGNRIPSITAEIAFSGTSTATVTLLSEIPEEDGGLPSGAAAGQVSFDGVRGYSYRSFSESGTAYVTVEGALPMQQQQVLSLTDIFDGAPDNTNLGTPPGIVNIGSNEGSLLYLNLGHSLSSIIVAVDPLTMRVATQWGDYVTSVDYGVHITDSTGDNGTIVGFLWKLCVGRLMTPEGIWDVLVGGGTVIPPAVWVVSRFGLDAAPDRIRCISTGVLVPYYTGASSLCSTIEGKRSPGKTEFWHLEWGNAGTTDDRVVVSIIEVGAVVCGADLVATIMYGDVFVADDGDGIYVWHAEYDRANDAIIMQVGSNGTLGGGSAVRGKLLSVARDGTITWQRYITAGELNQGLPSEHGHSRLMGTSYAYVADDDIYVLDTRTGEETATFARPMGSVQPGNVSAFDSLTGLMWSDGPDTSFQRFLTNRGTAGTAALSDVVSDICIACGLDAGDIDVTELSGDVVRGFIVSVEAGRDPIGQLAGIFFFDMVEEDDQLVFRKRGGSAVASVAYTDILRLEDRAALKPVRSQAYEIPRRITVRHSDPDQHYQQGAQHYARSQGPTTVKVVESVGEANLDVSLVLTADEAKTAAKRQLLMRWQERERYENIGLPSRYLALAPTDVITLGLADGVNTARVRLLGSEIGADFTLRVSAVVEDATLLDATATGYGGEGFQVPPLPGPYSVVPLLLPLPLLRDVDESGGVALRTYVAASTYPGQNFAGAQYLMSTSGVADFSEYGPRLRIGAAWGTATDALGDWSDAGVTDNDNALTVQMAQGGDQLTTATYDQVLNGANVAALLTSDGDVEVIQFQDVESLGNGRYRLTGLFRGRRGTEWTMGDHARGDRFVLLTEAALRAVSVDSAALNAQRYVKALGLFDTFDASPALGIIFEGVAEKPYAPCWIEGSRDGSNNLTITWIRRGRYGGEWADGTEAVPIGEEAEEYEVEILDGVTVVRTITGLSAATTTYSAANQTSDGLTPGDPVTVRVYQISALVDRGYGATATV